MPEYSELPTIIGKMKRAAADSYMAAQGWFTSYHDDTIYALWGFNRSEYKRPAKDGSGGGEPCGTINVGSPSLAPTFEAIRDRIDGITARWLDLPDGSKCVTPRDKAASAANLFGVSGAGSAVATHLYLTNAQKALDAVLFGAVIKGAFTQPFHHKYSAEFSIVSVDLGVACSLLHVNYATQQQLWPAAREDVVRLCSDAVDALNADVKNSGDAAAKVALTVVMVAGGAVATVATAGTAAPMVAVALGVAGAATLAVEGLEAHATITGSDCNSILDSLETALITVNAGIAGAESALNEQMNELLGIMESSPQYFNLNAVVMPSYPGVTEEVSLDQYNADAVTQAMDDALEVLETAKVALGSGPSSNPTPRHSDIGVGASGTFPIANDLYDLTMQYLSATAAEYARGEELFKATVADYFSTDDAAAALVKNLAADEALTNDS
jgi:hypothetical protein